jgi:polysaccharide pyruvyl transferase WcaK-like protein
MGSAPGKIALYGLFGSGNIGNDGSLEAILDFLRAALPDAELVCICANPREVQHRFQVPTFPISGKPATDPVLRILEKLLPARKVLRWLQAFKALRGVDAFIVPGTGALDNFGDRFWGAPASLLAWCLAARLRSARLAFVSVGAGPIDHPISRQFMKAAARMAHYRSYRDSVSREFMAGIGFDVRNDAVYPDIAFRLPAPAECGKAWTTASPPPLWRRNRVGEIPEHRGLKVPPSLAPAHNGEGNPPGACVEEGAGSLTVGLGVMTYLGWRGDTGRGAEIYAGYLRKITRFTLWLLDRGHSIRLLVGEDTDQKAVDDLLAATASGRSGFPRERIVAEPAHSLHDLMHQIAGTQAVVATRYHNIVCALKLCRPAVSVGYSKKNDALMADMGLADFCQHVERFDVDLLIAQFDRLVANRAVYERGLREKNTEYARRLAVQEQALLQCVLGQTWIPRI